MIVCNLFFSFCSHKWMRRSSWAPGLKSRGWRAAVEEPRPVTRVRIHSLTDPPWLQWFETLHKWKLAILHRPFLKTSQACFILQNAKSNSDVEDYSSPLWPRYHMTGWHQDLRTVNVFEIIVVVPTRFYGNRWNCLTVTDYIAWPAKTQW